MTPLSAPGRNLGDRERSQNFDGSSLKREGREKKKREPANRRSEDETRDRDSSGRMDERWAAATTNSGRLRVVSRQHSSVGDSGRVRTAIADGNPRVNSIVPEATSSIR